MTDEVRVWVVGLGTVGRWLLQALHAQEESLSSRYGFRPRVVGMANARDGFVYDARGLDLPTVLGLVSASTPITEHPEVSHWPSALAGLEATEADVLVEVTSSPPEDGEPGFTHMRNALLRRISVVTSNKWPVALHGVELAALAREQRVSFRAESTVMSGTPVVGPLVSGLVGTTPVRLRGVLNATANFVLTAMENGQTYSEALAESQEIGLAERDPSADVDGWDSMAKTMILAGLVFGEQLAPAEVFRRGLADIGREEVESALARGERIRLVSSLQGSDGRLTASVAPVSLPSADTLARIDGVTNAVVCEAVPVGEVTILGPGAGLELAGQGVFSDLIAACRERVHLAARPHEPW